MFGVTQLKILNPNWISTRKHLPPVFTLVNFYARLCLIPFSFNWDNSNTTIVIQHACRFRKVICFIFHFGCTFNLFSWVKYTLLEYARRKEAISPLFDLVSTLGIALMTIYLLNLIWRDPTTLHKAGILALDFHEFTFMDTLMIYVLCVSHFLVNFGYSLFTTNGWFAVLVVWNMVAPFVSQLTQCGTQDSDNSSLIEKSNSTFIFPEQNLYEAIKNPNNVPIFIQIVKCIFAIVFSNITIFLSVQILTLTSLAFTMQQVATSFKHKIHLFFSIEEGISYYLSLKRLQEILNKATRNLTLFYYFTTLSFYSESPYFIAFRKDKDFEYFLLNYSFIYMSFYWILSAIFHGMIQSSTQQWIQNLDANPSISLDDRSKVVSFADHIEREPIGFSGGFFVITKNTIGSMVGLVLTFAIIVYQVSDPKEFVAGH